MKNYLLISLILICSYSFGQREFGVNDSTFHVLNADTTIIASQKKLYFNSSAGTTLIKDFTTGDDKYFIRDFDIISDSVWYALAGSRYIGGDTDLYKTEDKGQSWSLDTTFYTASKTLIPGNFKTINQVQRFSEDTIVLFVGYYESGIAYTIDGGDTWMPWFSNLISFYHGIFKCGTDYYLFGIEGDGFPSSMFKFPDTLLFSPDTNAVWTPWSAKSYHPACYNRDTACIFAPNSISRYDQYRYHRDYIDSICSPVTAISGEDFEGDFELFPNPVEQGQDVLISSNSIGEFTQYKIFNLTGRLIEKGLIEPSGALKINTSNMRGMYCIMIEVGDFISYRKLFVR